MGPFPVAGVGPSSGRPRHGVRRGPAWRVPPSPGMGRVIEDEVGLRHAVALPPRDVLVVLRPGRPPIVAGGRVRVPIVAPRRDGRAGGGPVPGVPPPAA